MMATTSALRRGAFATLLMLTFPSACGDGGSRPKDAAAPGDGDGVDGGGRGDGGGGLSCPPKACEGMPIPAIACADGPTLVVCERGSDGQCHAHVRCGDGEGGTDAGRAVGKTCGGLANLPCAAGLFCNYEVDAGGTGCVGVADGAGVCEPLPGVCAALYAPVCGCDYRSYPSDCNAHARGASVMHDGLCTADECTKSGGRPEYSNGASSPSCKAGEDSFHIPGKEEAICCVPGTPSGLTWYRTCGAPVCGGSNQQPSGLPRCDTQKEGDACTEGAPECDLGNACGTHLICEKSDPTQGPAGCPRSRAAAKLNIRYLADTDLAQKHDEVLGLSIAEYTYRDDPAQQPRLGFIIEDVEPSKFVDEARDRVDLYAYTSAVIAAVKVQDARIRELEGHVRDLTRKLSRRPTRGRADAHAPSR